MPGLARKDARDMASRRTGRKLPPFDARDGDIQGTVSPA
jgi:hypothetical protein